MFIRNAWKRIRPRCYVVYSTHKRCMSQEAYKSKFYPFQGSARSPLYYWFNLQDSQCKTSKEREH